MMKMSFKWQYIFPRGPTLIKYCKQSSVTRKTLNSGRVFLSPDVLLTYRVRRVSKSTIFFLERGPNFWLCWPKVCFCSQNCSILRSKLDQNTYKILVRVWFAVRVFWVCFKNLWSHLLIAFYLFGLWCLLGKQ